MDEQQLEQIAQFSQITGAGPSTAQTALESANWNFQEAVTLFYAAQEELLPSDPEDNYAEPPALPSTSSTSATPASLPSAPAAAAPSTSSTSRSKRAPPTSRPKQMTMDDLKKREETGDDDSEDDKPQDMFAGGEKSGLAVHNPGQSSGSGGPSDHFKNIMNQARQNRDRPGAEGGNPDYEPGVAGAGARSSNFSGRAQTLGGDEAESQIVEDPIVARTRAQTATTERVSRTLHLWADGISIDDGPLFRFDDPANANIMAEINRGRAPLALLDVQPNQEVDLNLEPHKEENYVQPKKVYKPFGGEGQRLGSPVPSAGTTSTTTATSTTQSTPSSSAASTAQPPTSAQAVDESLPTIQLQIRLGDGTRLASRFNTTQTIGHVYDFVDGASGPASSAGVPRPYALMTTFPSRELSDRSVVLGDVGEYKRGGVVVQKWI